MSSIVLRKRGFLMHVCEWQIQYVLSSCCLQYFHSYRRFLYQSWMPNSSHHIDELMTSPLSPQHPLFDDEAMCVYPQFLHIVDLLLCLFQFDLQNDN